MLLLVLWKKAASFLIFSSAWATWISGDTRVSKVSGLVIAAGDFRNAPTAVGTEVRACEAFTCCLPASRSWATASLTLEVTIGPYPADSKWGFCMSKPAFTGFCNGQQVQREGINDSSGGEARRGIVHEPQKVDEISAEGHLGGCPCRVDLLQLRDQLHRLIVILFHEHGAQQPGEDLVVGLAADDDYLGYQPGGFFREIGALALKLGEQEQGPAVVLRLDQAFRRRQARLRRPSPEEGSRECERQPQANDECSGIQAMRRHETPQLLLSAKFDRRSSPGKPSLYGLIHVADVYLEAVMKAVRTFTILTLLVLNCITVMALGENFYGGVTDLLSAFRDPNTGLTSFPTLLIPMGGIAEGMGTAYTAVGADAGYIEYNPAASALLKTSELAFYHHNWIADSNMEGVVYTVRFNDFGMGFAGKFLYVPFTAYNEWGAQGATGLHQRVGGHHQFLLQLPVQLLLQRSGSRGPTSRWPTEAFRRSLPPTSLPSRSWATSACRRASIS